MLRPAVVVTQKAGATWVKECLTADLKLFDPAILMGAVEHNKESFDALSRVFLGICPELIQRLEEAIKIENFLDTANQAHTLASCMFVVGAIRVGEKLEEIERDARQKIRMFSSVEFVEMKRVFFQVMAEVEHNLLPENGESAALVQIVPC